MIILDVPITNSKLEEELVHEMCLSIASWLKGKYGAIVRVQQRSITISFRTYHEERLFKIQYPNLRSIDDITAIYKQKRA